MKARPDLTPDHTVVLSSPNDYYIDPQGLVNELEDDEERILFGTVANPRREEEPPADVLADFYAQCEEDVRRACNPATNPHLVAVNTIMEALGLSVESPRFQRPKDASIPPIAEEEEDD